MPLNVIAELLVVGGLKINPRTGPNVVMISGVTGGLVLMAEATNTSRAQETNAFMVISVAKVQGDFIKCNIENSFESVLSFGGVVHKDLTHRSKSTTRLDLLIEGQRRVYG